MKKITLLSCFILFGVFGFQAQTFYHDINESLALAKSSQKEVLMIFSGSDWCKPCMQLKNSVITSDEFSSFSSDRLVLLELDFPYRKKNRLPKEQQAHNEALAAKYNKEGRFPKVLLFNADQQLLGQINYKKNMPSKDFIDQIKELTPEKLSAATNKEE